MTFQLKGKLIACIGDEETCVGFLLGGIGEINAKKESNFFVVERDTPISDIEETFRKFIRRSDIEIILITQDVANQIRHVIVQHKQLIPLVMEIPSKNFPYDPNNDPVMLRAKSIFTAEK